MTHYLFTIASFASSVLAPALVSGQYVVENLGRGVVAVRASETTVYVGWRLLAIDPAEIAAASSNHDAGSGLKKPIGGV